MPRAPTISQVLDHESISASSTKYQQNVQDVFMSAPLILPAPSSPVFHFLTHLPRELQLHIFTLFLDSLIGKTRGLTPYLVDDYTQIRQLMDSSDLKAILQTNIYVRSIMLAAWKIALRTNRYLNNARQERRVEKALMLIEFLEDKEAHVYSMRLLLTCNASWDEVKGRAHELSAFVNEPPVLKIKNLGSLLKRLAVASVTIELHALTYATNGHGSNLISPGMLHYCPDLRQSNYMDAPRPWERDYLYDLIACPTHEEFEETWKIKCVRAQKALSLHGDKVLVAGLSRKVFMIRLPWTRGTKGYGAMRNEMYKTVVAYMEGVKRKIEVEQNIVSLSRKRIKEFKESTWMDYW